MRYFTATTCAVLFTFYAGCCANNANDILNKHSTQIQIAMYIFCDSDEVVKNIISPIIGLPQTMKNFTGNAANFFLMYPTILKTASKYDAFPSGLHKLDALLKAIQIKIRQEKDKDYVENLKLLEKVFKMNRSAFAGPERGKTIMIVVIVILVLIIIVGAAYVFLFKKDEQAADDQDDEVSFSDEQAADDQDNEV